MTMARQGGRPGAAQSAEGLFTLAGDPEPVEWVNPDSDFPVLLVCEHAGQEIPSQLDGLGLPEGAIDLHIGWDIGAEPLARAIATELGAPLILQRYSRLVIDCNRPPGTEGSIPHRTGGVNVPGNRDLCRSEVEARRREVFDPYDRAIKAALARNDVTSVFSIHSFTADFPGQDRPWDAGFLTRKDEATAHALMQHLRKAAPNLTLALNEPYRIEDESDWLIPRYAEARGLRHSLIEVRNHHILESAGQSQWATLLAQAIQETTKAPA